MSFLYLLAFGLPWVLLFAWLAKIVARRISYLKQREMFTWSLDAVERYGRYYQKKYKDVEIGEYDD